MIIIIAYLVSILALIVWGLYGICSYLDKREKENQIRKIEYRINQELRNRGIDIDSRFSIN